MDTLITHKLQNETLVNKVTSNWRISQTLQHIYDHIIDLGRIHFEGLKCKANSVGEKLENAGTDEIEIPGWRKSSSDCK